MNPTQLIRIQEGDATALIAPQLGGWLLQYSRSIKQHGMVNALHFESAVIGRWPKQMWSGIPVLFPLVSYNRVGDRDGCYEWEGQRYAMPQHGFARRSAWTVIKQDDTSVTLELIASTESTQSYPWKFSYRLSYWLADGRLNWEQMIENQSDTPMPYCSGFHPYFAVPLTEQSKRSDCYVTVPKARHACPEGDWEGYTNVAFPEQNLSAQRDIADTLILNELEKPELALVDLTSGLQTVLNFEGAPSHRFVAIWTPSTDSPFYCIEPWTALPNSFRRMDAGEILTLAPGETSEAKMHIELKPI